MKKRFVWELLGLFVLALSFVTANPVRAVKASNADLYSGVYCSGRGDIGYLRLIDQSFQSFHCTPYRQNISMVYLGSEERLTENFTWMMWWVQNSYGTTYCSLPYLKEPWITALQNAQDWWFKFQGDGKTIQGFPPEPAPLGSLCDCAGPTCVIYKQGDMDTTLHKTHDWFYEAAAAGVVMQAELLLIGRDMDAIKRYMPKLDLACNFVETTRDPKNNLFLVGAGSNLLAPSYGGVLKPDGTYGKGYLAGLSVNYLAAVDRMIELYKMLGDKKQVELYEYRRKITLASLPLLLVDKTYFAKSVEETGLKHGVYGQKEFGYFEVAPNVDAICFRTVSDELSQKIMGKITAIPELRPHDMLITNYPALDDIYADAGSTSPATMAVKKLETFGMWVDGGVWTTQEGRALMAYARTGRYTDILRSMRQHIEIANLYQLDCCYKQFGVNLMLGKDATDFFYDNLAQPAALARGLFEYVYSAKSLTLYPHIPSVVTEYNQHEPIRFGSKRITINVKNGGPKVLSVTINGRKAPIATSDRVILDYSALAQEANVEIVTGGRWSADALKKLDTKFVVQDPICPNAKVGLTKEMMRRIRVLTAMRDRIIGERGLDYEKALLNEAVAAYDSYRQRIAMNQSGCYPKLSPGMRSATQNWHLQGADQLYSGFETIMTRYAASGNLRQKRLAGLWTDLGKK